MLERDLEKLVISFLSEEKGYSRENLISQLAVGGGGVYRPDIVIIDTVNKEYIGVIELKRRLDKKDETAVVGQFYTYFSYLGTQEIPAFLITPVGDDDFQIFEFTKDNKFKPILKSDFPNFKTLSAKKITDEKIKHRELELQAIKEFEDRKRRVRQSSFLGILSVILGVIAAILSIFMQQSKREKQAVSLDAMNTVYEDLTKRILLTEQRLDVLSELEIPADTVFIDADVIALEKRISVIETGISENPEKTLSLLQIRQEIDALKAAENHSKELTQAKLEAIKNEMDIQNAWVLAVLIAVFGSILSIAIPNLFRKNEQK